MKNSIKMLIIVQVFSCYNIYGVALQEKKTNIIPSTPHVNYPLNRTALSEDSVPKSIIFININYMIQKDLGVKI